MAAAVAVKVGVEEVDEGPASDPAAQRKLYRALLRRRLGDFVDALRGGGVSLEHRYDKEKVTLLQRASALPGCHEFVGVLLTEGADPNARDARGRTALHYAAFQSHEAALRLLLKDKRTEVRAVDAEGSTALHYTALPSWTIPDMDTHLRCVALLMDHPCFEVNRPDGIGQTAIATAVLLHYNERIQVMLEHGRHRLNLDCARVANGLSVRELIRKRFPELERFLPPPRAESPSAPNPHLRLLAALQRRDLEAFEALLDHDAVDPNYWYDDPYYSTLLELAVRRRGAEAFVRALLRAGADPDTRNAIYGLPAAHQAVESANAAALEALLDAGARVDATDRAGHTALHVAAQKQCADQEESSNMQRCLSLLLDREAVRVESSAQAQWYDVVDSVTRPAIDIDAQDEFGDTALHDAAHYGNDEVVLALLRRGANVMLKNSEGEPALAFIDAVTLDTFLDEQIRSNGLSPLSEDYQLILRYTFLERCVGPATAAAADAADASRSEMEALHYMSRSPDLRPLLRHPVINSFLDMKWYMVRTFFYLNLIVYIVFVSLLTAYILLINARDETFVNCTRVNDSDFVINPIVVERADADKSSLVVNLECGDFDENCSQNYMQELTLRDVGRIRVEEILRAATGSRSSARKSCAKGTDDPNRTSIEEFAAHCLRIPLFYLLLSLFLREVIQLAMGWRRYVKDVENFVEFFMIVVCSVALSSDWENSAFKQHISAIAILLSWTELVFITGRLPLLSVQLEMLKKVSFTFLRFMAWYSLLIVAFALSFYTLFRRSRDVDPESREKFFLDPGLSIIRTFIMMVGEFEATELVFDAVPGTSHVVFVVFVFLVTIILLNLLNGLAVYDTQAIKEDAVILGLVSMVTLVAYLETMLIRISAATHFMYSGCYKGALEPRIRLFRTDLPKKQIHAFPNTGEVKFLLDARATARFRGYRLPADIARRATDVVTERKRVSDTADVRRRVRAYEARFDELLRAHAATQAQLADAQAQIAALRLSLGERGED